MGWDLYLKEVLGVSEIVMPVREVFAQAASHELHHERILFLAEPEDQKILELEIFQKMLMAMKLEFGEFAVWELPVVELSTEEKNIPNELTVVSFSDQISEFLQQQRPKLNLITTHHPLECIKNPQLKKPVWDALKRALSEAGLSDRLS